MGSVLLILLGLAAAGLVVDFLVENDLGSAPDQTVALLGGTFRLSIPELVLGGAVLGVLSVLLVMLGIGLLRGTWGRRQSNRRLIQELERENEALRVKANLATAVSAGTPEEGPEESHSPAAWSG